MFININLKSFPPKVSHFKKMLALTVASAEGSGSVGDEGVEEVEAGTSSD